MKKPYRRRTIRTAWLTKRRARRASVIFDAQTKTVIPTLAAVILLLTCGIGWAHPLGRAAGWIQPRAAWGQSGVAQFASHRATRPQQRHQEHLPQWFRQHEYLPPQGQERALRSEPGFNRLPPQEQQRLFNRLQQLNAMPPGRRDRTLQRMEALERLSPRERQQVRLAMQQITEMPEDRRRMMHRAFRSLTQLPPWQRQSALNSPQFKSEFTHQERQMLGTLMSVQPYSPDLRPGTGVQYGGRR